MYAKAGVEHVQSVKSRFNRNEIYNNIKNTTLNSV